MEDGDFVIDHQNTFNNLISQLVFVDTKTEEESKCITLLCSLPDFGDNFVVAIDNTTQFALRCEDVAASLLSVEMMRKSMENHNVGSLSMRGH